jgi:hypothetical protein
MKKLVVTLLSVGIFGVFQAGCVADAGVDADFEQEDQQEEEQVAESESALCTDGNIADATVLLNKDPCNGAPPPPGGVCIGPSESASASPDTSYTQDSSCSGRYVVDVTNTGGKAFYVFARPEYGTITTPSLCTAARVSAVVYGLTTNGWTKITNTVTANGHWILSDVADYCLLEVIPIPWSTSNYLAIRVAAQAEWLSGYTTGSYWDPWQKKYVTTSIPVYTPLRVRAGARG